MSFQDCTPTQSRWVITVLAGGYTASYAGAPNGLPVAKTTACIINHTVNAAEDP